jgi:hypothetical protein
MPTELPRRRWQMRPWQEALAILAFALLCVIVLVWSGLD